MNVCVIGLGYVGKTIASILSKNHTVMGIDTNENVVKSLSGKYEKVSTKYSEIIPYADIVLICVPTPIDDRKNPDMKDFNNVIIKLCACKYQKIICIESTVQPGTAEKVRYEFNCRELYPEIVSSPERINPYYDENGVYQTDFYKSPKIVGSTDKNALEKVCSMYNMAGVHTINVNDNKIAEYAKLLENVQRDTNIALVNLFSYICKADNVSFRDVLESAKTKYNFCDFHPGMIGGHCIGTDIYYLKSYLYEKNFYCNFDDTLLNEICYVNNTVKKDMYNSISEIIYDKNIKNIIMYGIAYKKNIDDIRESGSVKLYKELRKKEEIDDIIIYDPLCKPQKNICSIEDDTMIILGHLHTGMKDTLINLIQQYKDKSNVVIYNTTYEDLSNLNFENYEYMSFWN